MDSRVFTRIYQPFHCRFYEFICLQSDIFVIPDKPRYSEFGGQLLLPVVIDSNLEHEL